MFGHASHNAGADNELPQLLRAQSGFLALAVILNLLFLSVFEGMASVIIPMLLQRGWLPYTALELASELFTLLVYVGAFLPPYYWYAKAVGYSPRAIVHDMPYPPVLAASVGVALGASVVGILFTIVTAVFFAVFGLFPMELPIVFPTNPPVLALYLLNIAVVPALVEEFIMRGIVMGSLRRYGDRLAIMISALVFALLHRNMTQFPNALLLGLVLGYFVIKTNSIWTGVAIHFINNMLAVLLTGLTMMVGDMQGILVQNISVIIYIIAAIGGFLYLRVVRRVDLSLQPSPYLLPTTTLCRMFLLHFPMLLLLSVCIWMIFNNFS